MAAKGPFRNPKPVPRHATPLNDLVSGILDPVLRKRAGISLSLVQSWDEVVGPFAAARSRPEKVIWPRKAQDRDAFQPATLVIACESSAALELQHETAEIIARVNSFLGFGAIGKIRLVQKQIAVEEVVRREKPRPLDRHEQEAIRGMTARIEDPALRASLERLGATVKGSRPPRIKSA